MFGSLPQHVPRLTHGMWTPGAIVVVHPREGGEACTTFAAAGNDAAAPTHRYLTTAGTRSGEPQLSRS